MELKSGVLEEKYKFTIITILLACSSFILYYCHAVLQIGIIFTQLFYFPIILASLWWRKKGIVVAVFLAILLIFSHFILRPDVPITSDYLRSFMFIAISILVAILSEQIVKSEKLTEILQAELLQIFNNSSEGIQVINKDFNVLRINDTFSVLSGMSKDRLVGKKCYEVFINSLCHTPDCPLTRILGGEKLVERDIEKESSDGTKIFCMLKATPFQKPDGELIGIVQLAAPLSEAQSLVSQRWVSLGLGVLGVTAVATIAALWLSNTLVRPLGNLQQAANQVAAGDFSQRLPENRQDEIGELSRAFNHMAGQVQAMIEEQRLLYCSTRLSSFLASLGSWRLFCRSSKSIWVCPRITPMGLLISWAMPADKTPRAASFSDSIKCCCWAFNSSLTSFTRLWRFLFQPSISLREASRAEAISLSAAASRANSSLVFTSIFFEKSFF